MFQVIFIYVFITWSRFLSKHFCLQPFLYYLLIHYFARCADGEYRGRGILKSGSPDPWNLENAFLTHFLTLKTYCPSLIDTISPVSVMVW